MKLNEAIFKMRAGEMFDMGPGFNKIICTSENELVWGNSKKDVKVSDIRNFGHIHGEIIPIIPAEPKVMTAEECLQHYKNKPGPLGYFDGEMIEMFKKGDKNGARRMWLEFKKYLHDITRCGDCNDALLEDAVRELKPE